MSTRPSIRVPTRPTNSNGDGNAIANKILASILPTKESKEVLPRLEFVRLVLHQVIHEAGEKVKSGFFINSGLASVLAVQPDGKSVEVGLIGSEGFVGLPLLVGYHPVLQESWCRVRARRTGAMGKRSGCSWNDVQS